MLLVSFCSWWYGKGWQQLISSVPARLSSIAAAFSVIQLLRTLFAPWRRIMTYPGASLADRMRASADNAFSRIVGFVVRLFVLLAAGIFIGFAILLNVILIVAWPLLPLAIPGLIAIGALL